MKLLSFALGTLYKWSKDKNMASLLKYVKKLDLNGLELTLGKWEDVYNLKLTESDIKYLKSLDYVTIHAPFRILRRTNDITKIKSLLGLIERHYRKIDAKYLIIHPLDLPNPKILKKYNFRIITENVPKRYKEYRNLKYEKVFKKYPNIGLCLDVAHAYRCSKEENKRLVKKFRKRIKQIHLSGTYRNNDHLSLRFVTKEFIKSLEPIMDLDVPIVIEEGFGERENLGLIRKEIELVKDLLF